MANYPQIIPFTFSYTALSSDIFVYVLIKLYDTKSCFPTQRHYFVYVLIKLYDTQSCFSTQRHYFVYVLIKFYDTQSCFPTQRHYFGIFRL